MFTNLQSLLGTETPEITILALYAGCHRIVAWQRPYAGCRIVAIV